MKNEIIYGNVEVDDDLEQSPKIRTTIFLDLELKNNLKQEAKNTGIKYQQLVRDILNKHFSMNDSIEDRLKQLEKIVLKKTS